MPTLLDLLDAAVARHPDRSALGLRGDDGTSYHWTYRELARRSRLAAFRLRALGLEPGDRLLTLSPSTPELAAAYFGAMRARIIFVPLDLRMSADAIRGIVTRSGAKHLLLGTGRDAPNPGDVGLKAFPTAALDAIAADTTEQDDLPPDWEAQVETWQTPADDEVFELIFTSGTTGTPKGVMLAHDNVHASVTSFHSIIPRLEHRLVSLLPLSHLLEQSVGLYYAIDVGAEVLYVRSRNPRVIFEALREHRVTSMVVVPQVLDLFWSAIERQVEQQGRTRTFERLRRIARRLPMPLRRLIFRSVHARLGGGFRLFCSAGAFLPPAIQQAWEDLGVTVLQGYGTTETGTGACTTLEDHGLGTVGRPVAGIGMRLAEDGEVQFRGPTLFKGYWDDPAATAAAFTEDGWYRTGDVGRLDEGGRLILSGRKKDMIVLPNGFNVYPEDIENALTIAGIRDPVVLETRPGRIEAILLDPRRSPTAAATGGGRTDTDEDVRRTLDRAVKAANATLGQNQRVAGWRFWPEADFPRTHTLKVKRDLIRRWATEDAARAQTAAGGSGPALAQRE